MSLLSDSFIRVNEISLHYYRTGGNKPPILLLHGFTDNGLCWTHMAHMLEPDYDVIMFDARGHGLSEGPSTGFSHQLLANDATALIQALNLNQPFLLGHSMGAATAATVASQHPELVRAVLLEDPPWSSRISWLPDQNNKNEVQDPTTHSWYKWLTDLKAQTYEERIKAARIENPTWPEEELAPWAQAKEQFNLDTFGYSAPVLPWREIVQHITCPVLLITGDPEKGAIVTPEVAQEASHLWHSGQTIHIAGTGHNIRREQFDHYKEVITTFLREQ